MRSVENSECGKCGVLEKKIKRLKRKKKKIRKNEVISLICNSFQSPASSADPGKANYSLNEMKKSQNLFFACF